MSCREIFMKNLTNRFFRFWPMLLLVLAAGSGRVLAAGTWSATDPMEYERYWFTATTLLSGQVLVTGGYSYETYDLATAPLCSLTAGFWWPPVITAARCRVRKFTIRPQVFGAGLDR